MMYKIIQELKNLYLLQCNYVLIDYILRLLIGDKARWYQIHVIGNSMVLYHILNDTIQLYIDPLSNYKELDNNYASYIILTMHIHHIIFFKLNKMDYFHHILFILLGVLPTIFLVNTNQIYMGYIACSGIPGIIEYSAMTLYKNNYISLLKQKKIIMFIYNFIRYPMCIYGFTINLLSRNYNNILLRDNIYISMYINFLLYLNGSIFNLMSIESYVNNLNK